MQVLHVINDLGLGGAQRMLLAHTAGLDRARFAPIVASLELDPSGALAQTFRQRGVPVVRLRARHEPPAIGLVRLAALMRRVRPALVHTHLVAAGLAGRTVARFTTRARIVTTLHNTSDWIERAGDPLRRMDRADLAHADLVIAVSDAVRGAFARRCPGLATRAVTVRNGIDAAAFATTPAMRAVARARFGYGPDDVVVGVVARLERRKGIDLLLAAVARARRTARSLRLHIVGDGPERRGLQALAQATDIAEVTRFAGYDADVRAHLAACDLAAVPSRSEGLGLSAIEAQAAGVPVLAARTGGLPELLGGSRSARLLPPGDEARWSAVLLELAADHGTRTAMAREGPAWAARFTLAASVHALESAYARVLGETDAEVATPLARAA